MIRHSEFTKWLYTVFPNTDKNLINKIVVHTNTGVSPEAIRDGKHRMLELVAKTPDDMFYDGPEPAPIPPPEEKINTGFRFGQTSLIHMEDVAPILRKVATLALEKYSIVDFGCTENQSRTEAQQRLKVQQGVSQTMHSKHRIQGEFSYALDLVAWVAGKWSWDWTHYYHIAYAMDQAATELGVANSIRWGGAWDRVLSDFGGDIEAYKREVESYAARHPGKDFIDGPHFEWVA